MITKRTTNFWNWFNRFGNAYKFLPQIPRTDIDFWMSRLSEHLQLYCKYDWQIDFKQGPDGTNTEMIFTAKRQLPYFDMISQLVEQAPPIPGWKFHALYPPMPPAYKIVNRFGPTCIEPDELWINRETVLPVEGGKFFVNVYAEIYDPADIMHRKIIEAILFNILGERSMVLDLAGFKVTWLYSLSQESRYKCAPLYKLPAVFARMKDPDYAGGEHRQSA